MTTAELIQEHLGPNWWEREHETTALAVLLDRLMENDKGTDLDTAKHHILFARNQELLNAGLARPTSALAGIRFSENLDKAVEKLKGKPD